MTPFRLNAFAAAAVLLAACSGKSEVDENPVSPTPISYSTAIEGADAAGPTTINEASTSSALVLTFAGGAPRAFTLNYVIAGANADIAPVSSSIAIAAGQASASIPLRPVDDELIESPETFTVALTATDSSFEARTVTVEIVDDDLPYVVTLPEDAQVQEPDRGSIVTNLKVEIDRPAANDLVLPFTATLTNLDDGDVAALPSSITIPAGETSALLPVTLLSDDFDEPDGTIVLNFTSIDEASFDRTRVALTVTDFEATPTISFQVAAQGASEATVSARVVVTATPASKQAIAVTPRISGTATQGSDYTLPAGFSAFEIPARSTSGQLDIGIVNDGKPEGDETIILDLDPPSYGALGTPATHTLTITGAIAINDTAVRTRIGNSTTHPGQDADHGRDAKLGRVGFSFTKVDANGNPVSDSAPAGAWSCVRDNVTGLTWEAKQININSATGAETPFVEATTELDFDINADGIADVNTQPAIGGDDWRAYSARYTWYSTESTTNGGVLGSVGDFTGMTAGAAPFPQSAVCGYRPNSASTRPKQAQDIFNACKLAQQQGTPESPGPASCTLPVIDDGQAIGTREYAAQCNTNSYRSELLNLNVCGRTGWHLPSIEQLRGIASYADGSQGISYPVFFPFAPPSAELVVWSADTLPNQTEQGLAYCMNAKTGVIQTCAKNIPTYAIFVSE